MVGRRINGLIDTGERFGIPIIIHREGEGMVVLGDDPLEPLEKDLITSHQHRESDVFRIGRGNP